MAVKKGLSREDKLAKIRERLQHVDLGGGKGFWSPKQGRNVIRILPPVKTMEYFFQEVGRHNLSPDGKKKVYCPSFTSGGELECPVCEIVKELRDAGDKGSDDMAKQLSIRKMYWMNIINRDDQNAGPLIYTPGVTVFGDIVSLVQDPDYGDIYDVDEGIDIIIERKGSGMQTEYSVKPRREATVLCEDSDLCEKWLEAASDLSYVEVSDDPEEDKTISKGHAVFLLPYDRIVKDFNLDNIDEVVEDEDEVEEEVVPKKSPTKKQRTVVIEEEEDEDDEEEEEEDETPPAKREVSRRQARRRGR